MFRRLQPHIHHVLHHTTSLNIYMIHVIGKYPLFSFGPGKFSSLAPSQRRMESFFIAETQKYLLLLQVFDLFVG